MKNKLALLLCFILFFLGTSVYAEAESRISGDFTYIVLGDGTVEITGYSGYADTLTIPNELDGFTVSSIDDLAFKNCTNLISVIIPDSVTSIGEWAFADCQSLASVIIYGNITSIGDWVFCNCRNLTSVMIPDSVTSIGERAFNNCQNLTSVIIPDSVTFIGDAAFMDCRSLTSITIPDGVTTIGDMVFYNCQSLTSVAIPNNVTSIGALAFDGCISLKSVTIPDSVTSIGDQAFFNCQSLTSLTIPDSVTSIGVGAFPVDNSFSDSVTQSSSSPHSVHSLDVDLTPGDYVTFGHYEQDNDIANGSEEIEWLALDVQNDKTLLISRYALDSVVYHNQFADVTWQNCDLRSWLNEDFLVAAFSNGEQAAIVMTDVDNSVNQGNRDWNMNGGNNTKDKIFLLSCKEVEHYFPSETSRVCKPTAYGLARGIYTDGDLCLWLLRSPGMDQYKIANVNTNGTFWDTSVNFAQYAIRPALWVNLKSEHIDDDNNATNLTALLNDNQRLVRLGSGDKIVVYSEDSKEYLLPDDLPFLRESAFATSVDEIGYVFSYSSEYERIYYSSIPNDLVPNDLINYTPADYTAQVEIVTIKIMDPQSEEIIEQRTLKAAPPPDTISTRDKDKYKRTDVDYISIIGAYQDLFNSIGLMWSD